MSFIISNRIASFTKTTPVTPVTSATSSSHSSEPAAAPSSPFGWGIKTSRSLSGRFGQFALGLSVIRENDGKRSVIPHRSVSPSSNGTVAEKIEKAEKIAKVENVEEVAVAPKRIPVPTRRTSLPAPASPKKKVAAPRPSMPLSPPKKSAIPVARQPLGAIQPTVSSPRASAASPRKTPAPVCSPRKSVTLVSRKEPVAPQSPTRKATRGKVVEAKKQLIAKRMEGTEKVTSPRKPVAPRPVLHFEPAKAPLRAIPTTIATAPGVIPRLDLSQGPSRPGRSTTTETKTEESTNGPARGLRRVSGRSVHRIPSDEIPVALRIPSAGRLPSKRSVKELASMFEQDEIRAAEEERQREAQRIEEERRREAERVAEEERLAEERRIQAEAVLEVERLEEELRVLMIRIEEERQRELNERTAKVQACLDALALLEAEADKVRPTVASTALVNDRAYTLGWVAFNRSRRATRAAREVVAGLTDLVNWTDENEEALLVLEERLYDTCKAVEVLLKRRDIVDAQ